MFFYNENKSSALLPHEMVSSTTNPTESQHPVDKTIQLSKVWPSSSIQTHARTLIYFKSEWLMKRHKHLSSQSKAVGVEGPK